MTPRPCPLCGGTGGRALHVWAERRMLRCPCGFVYVDPLPSPEWAAATEARVMRGELQDETATMFEAYGRDYRPDDPVVQAFTRHLATVSRMTAGRRLLDVGVGSGLLIHLARSAGWRAEGVDLCIEAAERARTEFGAAVTVGDFVSCDLPGGYDAIAMADVLEHSRDPRAFLERARALLAPGGVLYVAVPNHRSLVFGTLDVAAWLPGGSRLAERLYVPYHYQYFNPRTLSRLLREVGFEVQALERENPHLGRYRIPAVVRLGLGALLATSRALGLEARVVAFARRPVRTS